MLDSYKEMLRSRNYEVGINIQSDDLIIGQFPEKIEYPPQQEMKIEYDLSLYPKYAVYHLVMSDIIRRCLLINYSPSLITLYYRDKPLSLDDFVTCINMSPEDRFKHNKIGYLIHRVANTGYSPQLINEAKKYGILEYLQLITKLSGIT